LDLREGGRGKGYNILKGRGKGGRVKTNKMEGLKHTKEGRG